MTENPEPFQAPVGGSSPLPPAVPAELLEAAAALMEGGQIGLEEAAARFRIPPDSLHRYHRARNRHAEPLAAAPGPPASGEDTGPGEAAARIPSLRESGKHLDRQERESFNENWERRARLVPETAAPGAVARFCSRHTCLRWLVREGALDPGIATGVLVLLGGGAVVTIAAVSGAFSSAARDPQPASPPSAAASPVSPYTTGAKEVIREFLAADDAEARRPFLRDPETNAPLIEKWLAQGQPPLPTRFEYLFFEELIEYSGKRFLLFSGLNGLNETPTPLIVDATSEPFAFDWQASVAYQSMDWATFLHSRPAGEYPFRVFASLSDQFHSGFENQNLYFALELSIPKSTDSIHAFVARDAPLGRQIATVFLTQESTAATSIRLFPVLSFNDVPDGDQRVTITSLAAEDWMLP